MLRYLSRSSTSTAHFLGYDTPILSLMMAFRVGSSNVFIRPPEGLPHPRLPSSVLLPRTSPRRLGQDEDNANPY